MTVKARQLNSLKQRESKLKFEYPMRSRWAYMHQHARSCTMGGYGLIKLQHYITFLNLQLRQVVPQSLAYAVTANLPAVYGLYASYIGT